MFVSLFIASLPYWKLKLGYFWISPVPDVLHFSNFWRHSWDVSTQVPNKFKFVVCLSVCSLPHFLTEIRLSLDISKCIWAIFFQIFGRHSRDVSALVKNNFRFLVCLSVCSMPQFLTKIRLSLDICSSRWSIFFKFSGDIPGMFLHLFKIISDFLYVCQSVHCLTSLLILC